MSPLIAPCKKDVPLTLSDFGNYTMPLFYNSKWGGGSQESVKSMSKELI